MQRHGGCESIPPFGNAVQCQGHHWAEGRIIQFGHFQQVSAGRRLCENVVQLEGTEEYLKK